tara:strand:- start:248 stop:820 length:573 start_codon:yes stop_codon:yes gene_type:complete
VRVRVARASLNYCIELAFDGLNDDNMADLNAAISVSRTTTSKELTKEEVSCWVFHKIPLISHDRNAYKLAMASYQRITKDVLDMLSSESIFYTAQMLDAEYIEVLVGLREVVLGGIGPAIQDDDEDWSALPPLPSRPRPESAVPTHAATPAIRLGATVIFENPTTLGGPVPRRGRTRSSTRSCSRRRRPR